MEPLPACLLIYIYCIFVSDNHTHKHTYFVILIPKNHHHLHVPDSSINSQTAPLDLPIPSDRRRLSWRVIQNQPQTHTISYNVFVLFFFPGLLQLRKVSSSCREELWQWLKKKSRSWSCRWGQTEGGSADCCEDNRGRHSYSCWPRRRTVLQMIVTCMPGFFFSGCDGSTDKPHLRAVT